MAWTLDGEWKAASDDVNDFGCRRRAGRFWTDPEAQGGSVPGQPRSADTLYRVRASGCRYGRLKVAIRSRPRFRASRACGKCVHGGLRVHDWRRTSPQRACCAPRGPDFARLEGVQPPIRWALRTVGPLQHAPKRSVRPRCTRPRFRSLGPASARAVRSAPTKRSERGRSGILVASPSTLMS